MDFNFTPEQDMLRESLARFLGDHYAFADRQAMVRSTSGWRPEVWRGLADEVGVLGAPFPESVGGLGGGPVESMIVMEEIGKALAIEPYLETAVIGGALLRRWHSPRARELIADLVAGKLRCALAQLEPDRRFDLAEPSTTASREGGHWRVHGLKDAVRAAPFATHFIVTARIEGAPAGRPQFATLLVARDATGVSLREYPTVDGTRAADVRFESAPAESIGEPDGAAAAFEAAIDEGIAALCAEAVGVMRRLLSDTVEYTKQRRQFDAPIGVNQALQHRMVDMYMALEQAVSMTCYATLRLDRPALERARAVSAAKVFVSKAARFVGQSAIQLHGGIGMTDETAVSHYFRRAAVIESQLGSADYHCSRIERCDAAA